MTVGCMGMVEYIYSVYIRLYPFVLGLWAPETRHSCMGSDMSAVPLPLPPAEHGVYSYFDKLSGVMVQIFIKRIKKEMENGIYISLLLTENEEILIF